MNRWIRAAAVAVAAVLCSTFMVATAPSPAYAASFSAGDIISDVIFYNGTGMSESEVTSFIAAKNAGCTATSSRSCIRDYRADVVDRSANQDCGAVAGGSQLSAATIIYRIAVGCGISPRVLMVTLQKEQGLITNASTQAAFDQAMGWNCPDSTGCTGASAGFAYQVYMAAKQFKVYRSGRFGNYQPGGTYSIAFHPNGNCGSTRVLISNWATAGLYNYTPYQPNAALLAGGSDGCSSYGNYNFFTLFTSWFGSTHTIPGSPSFVTAAYHDVLGRGPSSAEQEWWVSAMATGTSRLAVAGGFNNSDEYRMIRINQAYTEVLGRPAESSGAQWWLQAMQQGRFQPDDAYRTFLAEPEYYANAGGGTDAGFLSALYKKILFRQIDQGGLDYWSDKLGRYGRTWVVNEIWFAEETYGARVATTYRALLGRAPSAADRSYWTSVARTNGDTGMRSLIMTTDEYWSRAEQRFPS